MGGGYYYFSQTPSAAGKTLPSPAQQKDDSNAQNKGKPLNAVFKGGEQGFVGLQLESVEEVNHNTKKFRFALPEKDDVSGLHVACTYTVELVQLIRTFIDDWTIAALLTMYKGPDMEKVCLFLISFWA